MKQALEKLRLIQDKWRRSGGDSVSYYDIEQTLEADLAWKESIERHLEELDTNTARIAYETNCAEAVFKLKPSVQEKHHTDCCKQVMGLGEKCICSTQELVTVEDKSKERILEDEVFCMIHDPKVSCADIIKHVRSHSKDMVMIPRDVAEGWIKEAGVNLPNKMVYKSTNALFNAIKQSLKGQNV